MYLIIHVSTETLKLVLAGKYLRVLNDKYAKPTVHIQKYDKVRTTRTPTQTGNEIRPPEVTSIKAFYY